MTLTTLIVYTLTYPTSLEYRSGNKDCVHMRHGLYIQCLYRHSPGCRDVQFSDLIVLWQSGVNVLIIYLAGWRYQHLLRQFSNFLTFYFRILEGMYVSTPCNPLLKLFTCYLLNRFNKLVHYCSIKSTKQKFTI